MLNIDFLKTYGYTYIYIGCGIGCSLRHSYGYMQLLLWPYSLAISLASLNKYK